MKTKVKAVIAVGVALALFAALLITRHWGVTTGLKAAFDAEFLTRPDGYRGLAETYDFRFPSEPLQMDPGLMYRAVADGAVDVIDGFATDGRIPAYDLLVLEDDKGFFPPYYAAPLVRKETLEKQPELRKILDRLAGKISDDVMQRMNYEVDETGRTAADVAREFLLGQALIPQGMEPSEGSAGSVTIGGKQFTEQEVLGEIMAILIETNSNIRVERRLNLGGTMICFNALKAGDLDVYPEYTGTGLVNILSRDVIANPDEAYRVVQETFEEQFGLIWLEPFGLNNTYTLTMRRDHAGELGIASISDLATYVNKAD